ncbi:alkane hydroxylase MAH1-like [Malania oleifera]|uniref:alkane hydroxylase MAH1-like n=1 Tax=Malania oleifera TaxID=397392 RepID=UPI0025AE4134|nr:alkane hydroxylase MAH1-like [Malania oleifera]
MATIGVIVAELFLALLFILLFYSQRRSKGSPMTDWPLVGMLPGLLHHAHHIHDYATHLMKLSGFTFHYKGPWLANMDMLITVDPANVHHILSKHYINFERGPEFKRIFEPFGDGIFNSDNDWWKFQRKFTHSLLKHDKFQRFLVTTTRRNVEQRLLPVLRHFSELGTEVDMQELLQRFSFDNNCSIILGFDPGCLSPELPQVSYATAFNCMEEAVLYRHLKPEFYWQLQKWLQVGEEKKLSSAWAVFDRFLIERISAKREELRRRAKHNDGDNCADTDLLTACIEEAQGDDKQTRVLRKSDKFVRDTAFNLLGAGRGTITAAMSWFIWLVATNPSVEKKIREEIEKNLGQQERKSGEKWRVLKEEEVNKLVYLHAAICESLRLYPPIPLQHKSPVQPDTLPSGHRVGPDTKVLLSSYSMGRMEEIWGKDCSEFRPERWVSEKGGVRHEPSYKFLAFNAGPRSCIGKEMSFVQLKIIATAILCNYEVKVVEGHPISPRISVVLHMKHGLKVRVSERCSTT